jgi:rhomboid protease GluP
LLDELVELVARAADLLGMNGTRLRWRWNQRRLAIAERKQQAAVRLRSARGRHKMCPSCRALVPRSAKVCPECDAGLAGVRGPGVGRFVSNLLPGATMTTTLILLVNGLFFLLMLLTPARALGNIEPTTGFMRLIQLDLGTLYLFGAGHGYSVLPGGEWWRLITPIFLHGGLIHFGFNSFVLMQLGPLVEEEYGTERFWAIYLFCGIFGNVVSQIWDPRTLVVGASGAIVGMIGLMIVYGTRRGGVAGRQLKGVMIQYAVFILIISLLPRVSFSAHLGGFLGGFLLGWIVPIGPFKNRATAAVWEGLALTGVALVLLAFFQIARNWI